MIRPCYFQRGHLGDIHGQTQVHYVFLLCPLNMYFKHKKKLRVEGAACEQMITASAAGFLKERGRKPLALLLLSHPSHLVIVENPQSFVTMEECQ